MHEFRKERPGTSGGFFETEAAGLRWLAAADAVRVAKVLDVDHDGLTLERVETARPSADDATNFGANLAKMHAAGAKAFGCLPPDGAKYFFGPLDSPLELPSREYEKFGEFYAADRIEPLVQMCVDAGKLSGDDEELLSDILDRLPDYAIDATPARVHGDLWSGNVMWARDGAVLIDPAACGNHVFADLAMLTMFSVPYEDEILGAYADAAGLDAGWRDELPLHQLFGLLVHLYLFGSSYHASVMSAAKSARSLLR